MRKSTERFQLCESTSSDLKRRDLSERKLQMRIAVSAQAGAELRGARVADAIVVELNVLETSDAACEHCCNGSGTSVGNTIAGEIKGLQGGLRKEVAKLLDTVIGDEVAGQVQVTNSAVGAKSTYKFDEAIISDVVVWERKEKVRLTIDEKKHEGIPASLIVWMERLKWSISDRTKQPSSPRSLSLRSSSVMRHFTLVKQEVR